MFNRELGCEEPFLYLPQVSFLQKNIRPALKELIIRPDTKFKVNPEANAMQVKTRMQFDLVPDIKVEGPPELNIQNPGNHNKEEDKKSATSEEKPENLKFIKAVRVYEFYENEKGQQLIRNIRQNKNRNNRKKLAFKLEEQAQHPQDEHQNENPQIHNNLGGIAEVLTDHHSPTIEQESNRQEEDDQDLNDLLPESKAVSVSRQSQSQKSIRELSKKASFGSELDQKPDSLASSLLNQEQRVSSRKPSLVVPIKDPRVNSKVNNINDQKICFGDLKKQPIQGNVEFKERLLKKQSSLVLGVPPSNISIVREHHHRKSDLSKRVNFIGRALIPQPNNQEIKDAPEIISKPFPKFLNERRKSNDKQLESSSSSEYEEVEIMDKAQEIKLSAKEEKIKSPPHPSRIAWDLKNPESPLRMAIRKNRPPIHEHQSGFKSLIRANYKQDQKVPATSNHRSVNYELGDLSNSWDRN